MRYLQGREFFYTSVDRFIDLVCLILGFPGFYRVTKSVVSNGELFKKINLHFFIFYYIIQAKSKDFFGLAELLQIIKCNPPDKINNWLARKDLKGLSTKFFCFFKFLKIYLKQ